MKYMCDFIDCPGAAEWEKQGLNGKQHYCQIHFSQKNNMASPNKPSDELPTDGQQETKRSKQQESDTAYTAALAATGVSETKINSSTTFIPWSELKEEPNLSESMPEDSSSTSEDGRSSAPSATAPSQPEKMNSDVGIKFDEEKPVLAYIPKAALYAEGEAFAYGAKKYEAWNYKNGIAVTRTLSAALRHIYQFLSGEDIDVESGVSHLGSARANLGMAIDTLINHPDLDDRFKGGKK